MKINSRQIIIILTTLVTLSVNGLANSLPINGVTTGEISDRFNTYFVPAGYVFSIWGLIYLGLIAFTIYQALPAQQEDPRLEKIGWWVVLANLANAAWIFAWHYQIFALTLVLMVALLISLLMIYQGLDIGQTQVDAVDKWVIRLPFSIYLGWISVATIVNTSDVLDFFKWGQFGISDEIWMIIILAVVAMLGWAMSLRRGDVAYLAVLLWALAGIGVKFPDAGQVSIAIWISFGLVALAALWAMIPFPVKSAD